jgi:8-oxo-dGTP diphosphatase
VKAVAQAGGIVYRGSGRDLSILLVSSKKEAGNWIFPKGHVEEGEDAPAAALRETQEEAGVDGELVGPVGPLEFDWRGKRYLVEYFLIRATAETPDTDGRDKVWLPFDEAIDRLTYEETRHLLREARPLMERRDARVT